MDPTAELLQQLNDIELPVETGLGIAPGWFIVAVFAVLLLVSASRAWLKHKRRKARDWRPSAMSELDKIQRSLSSGNSGNVVADCSRLARRVALAVAPRTEVAALSGDAWLEKLDEIAGSDQFSQGPGQVLATGPYRSHQSIEPSTLNELVSVLEKLIKTASRRKPVAAGPASHPASKIGKRGSAAHGK